MATRVSLNRSVSWSSVYDALDLPLDVREPPTVTWCPLCTARCLQILRDCRFGGWWYHCHYCGSHGDLLELVSKALELDLHQTVTHLSSLGARFPADVIYADGVATYEALHVDRRQRMNDLRDRAGRNLATDINPYFDLVDRFNLRVSSGGRIRRMEQFIGGIDFVDAAKAFQPHVMNKTLALSGSFRLFKGGGWGKVLAIPFRGPAWPDLCFSVRRPRRAASRGLCLSSRRQQPGYTVGERRAAD